MIEFAGIAATLLILIGFLFKDIKLIRTLNLIGSVCFVVYGFGVGAVWTGVLNAALVLVHIYHLTYLSERKKK